MQATNRNLALRHAFEALPSTVLSTEVGKLVFNVMTRNATQRVNTRKGAGRSK